MSHDSDPPSFGLDNKSSGHDASTAHHGSSVRTYVLIAVALAVLTYIEVELPNLLAHDRPLMATSLVVTAFVKAGLVAAFYMHLKFDSRIYTGVLALAGLLISYFLVFLLWGPLPLP